MGGAAQGIRDGVGAGLAFVQVVGHMQNEGLCGEGGL